MRTSDKPTEHILIKASTNSQWDCCEFALIHLSEGWKQQQTKRLEAVKPFADDYEFQSLRFYDGPVEFFQSGDDGEPDIEELLADRDWAFVELDDDEQERLTPPESRLDCYRIVIYRDGDARYEAYGKYTNEEFWTNAFSLPQLTGQTVETGHDTCEVLPAIG